MFRTARSAILGIAILTASLSLVPMASACSSTADCINQFANGMVSVAGRFVGDQVNDTKDNVEKQVNDTKDNVEKQVQETTYNACVLIIGEENCH